MFHNSIASYVVQMSIMQIVDVVSVLNCGVTATLTMHMRVLGMFFVRHRWLPLKEDHCLWRIVQRQGSSTLAPCQPEPKNNAETAETPVVVIKVTLGHNHGFAPHCQILQLVVLHSQALNKSKSSKAVMNSFARIAAAKYPSLAAVAISLAVAARNGISLPAAAYAESPSHARHLPLTLILPL